MTVRDRVSQHRARLRAQGLRPVQIWLPDVRSEAFVEEARRQSALLVATAVERDDMDFVESITADWDA